MLLILSLKHLSKSRKTGLSTKDACIQKREVFMARCSEVHQQLGVIKHWLLYILISDVNVCVHQNLSRQGQFKFRLYRNEYRLTWLHKHSSSSDIGYMIAEISTSHQKWACDAHDLGQTSSTCGQSAPRTECGYWRHGNRWFSSGSMKAVLCNY